MACRGNVVPAHNLQNEELATMLTLCLRDSGRTDEARQIMSLIETMREVAKNLKELDLVCALPPYHPPIPRPQSSFNEESIVAGTIQARCRAPH
jgi:hypothetical protein